MEEVWKDIPGYEGRYQASTEGKIRSLTRQVPIANGFTRLKQGRVLKPGSSNKTGHLSVVLGHKVPGTPVHQLVALTFLGPCPDGQEVLHNNGDPTDNRVENLRYGTRTANILDVYRVGKPWRKLTADDVVAIRKEAANGTKRSVIAEKYGISVPYVSSVITGKKVYWWLTDEFIKSCT